MPQHLAINPDVYRRKAAEIVTADPMRPGVDRRIEALANALTLMCDRYDELRAFFGVVPGEWLKWDEGEPFVCGRGDRDAPRRVSLDLDDDARMDVSIPPCCDLDDKTLAALREIGEAMLRKMRDPEADDAFLDAVENGGFAPGEEDG